MCIALTINLYLLGFYSYRRTTTIQTAENSKIKALAVGSCEVTLIHIRNRPHAYAQHNVIYHRSSPANLVSPALSIVSF